MCRKAESIIEQCNDVGSNAIVKSVRAWVAMQDGDFHTAEELFLQSIGIALSIKTYLFAMEPIYGLAILASKKNDLTLAVTLSAFLLHQKSTPTVTRVQAELLFNSIKSDVKPDELTELLNAGQQMTLEQVVTQVKETHQQTL